MDVELAAVFLAPEGDERGLEVAGAGVRDGEDGGLEVVRFGDVGLQQGNRLSGETCQGDALDVPVADAPVSGARDVGRQVDIGEVHDRDGEAVAQR